jgi:hypothetical protein
MLWVITVVSDKEKKMMKRTLFILLVGQPLNDGNF